MSAVVNWTFVRHRMNRKQRISWISHQLCVGQKKMCMCFSINLKYPDRACHGEGQSGRRASAPQIVLNNGRLRRVILVLELHIHHAVVAASVLDTPNTSLQDQSSRHASR